MAVFKFVISEPKSRKSFQTEVDQDKVIGLVGKKIGDDFNGDLIGLNGYVLKITGGTDKDGFPMHPRLKGTMRKKLLLVSPPGFKPLQKGQRKRKMVRGDTISEDVVQINVKVVKLGEKSFEQLAPKKEVKKEEAKKEEAKEVPKEEPKKAPEETPKKKPTEKPVEQKPEKKEEKPEPKKEPKVEPKQEAKTKPEPKEEAIPTKE